MPYLAPSYRILLQGRNITPAVDARLSSLELTECRGEEADRLDLVLTDHDGKLQLPTRGVTLELAIGWEGHDLVDKGTFIVNEVEHSGAPDLVTVRARSADLSKAIRARSDRSYHAMTLGAIVRQVAARHKLEVRIDEHLGARAIPHIDQAGESDVAFLTRLARLHDAVSTVKRGKVIFLPMVDTKSSTGDPMPVLTFTRVAGDNHRYQTSERDAYGGVRAYWHDPKRAKRRGVLIGKSGNAKRLRDTFANEIDARVAALAEWRRIQRGAATMDLALATGEALLAPQTKVKLQGFKDAIDAVEWLTIRVFHTIGDGGFTSRIEMEHADADQSEAIEPRDDGDHN